MDLFEKINKAFGSWYEGLFGSSDDVRPKDVLRRILTALEEHRKEGFDSRVYVPNQYILEIAVDDEEEKEYLLSFLDREELETAVRRYCQQNHYHIRGALDFTIKEVEPKAEGRRHEKVRVRCRYDSKLAAQKTPPSPVLPPPAGARMEQGPEEAATVYEVGQSESSDMGTIPAVAAARLTVYPPGRAPYDVPIVRGVVTIGRSARAGNDVVLAEDGMVSRRHARIELDADGHFTLYDLDTTNGTRVNGRKIDNRALKSGDEITVGATRLLFHQEPGAGEPGRSEPPRPRPALRQTQGPRLVLTDGAQDVDDFVLASETVIGRGMTNDIVLSDRSVATRHVRLVLGEPCMVEALTAEGLTLLNGSPLAPGVSTPLRSGDRIGIGTLTLRFEEGHA